MTTRLGYRACLDWLLANDDTTFLDADGVNEANTPSVTVCLVADIFGKPDEIVVTDLRKRRAITQS